MPAMNNYYMEPCVNDHTGVFSIIIRLKHGAKIGTIEVKRDGYQVFLDGTFYELTKLQQAIDLIFAFNKWMELKSSAFGDDR